MEPGIRGELVVVGPQGHGLRHELEPALEEALSEGGHETARRKWQGAVLGGRVWPVAGCVEG